MLKVGYGGTVSTAAVLPAGDPIVVSAELAAGVGFPACVAGFSCRFEPVPADVEEGGDGWLYVTSLPGGPEDASLGARGAVYRFNPAVEKCSSSPADSSERPTSRSPSAPV